MKSKQKVSDGATTAPGVAPMAVPALPKMVDAREALPRYSRPARPRCTAKIDRFVIGCAEVFMAVLLALSGYRRIRSHWLKPKTPTDFIPYGRITVLRNEKSGAQILVYSERKSRKLDPYQITFIPNDKLGLQPEDVLAVAECVEGHRIALVEVAFDFPIGSGVDCAFVRRNVLLGKCREYSVGEKPGWDAWGSRKGAKFVRSYHKDEVDGHRLELQLQTRFLRENQINEISDLPRLATILPRHHVWFARLSEEKLGEALRKSGLAPEKVHEILEGARARKGNLWATLRYLRQRAGLKNARRLLVPLATNRDIREALNKWASQWRNAIQAKSGR